MWIDLATKFYPDSVFAPGASEAARSALQEQLGVRLPKDLLDLLGETDGILDEEAGFSLIWPAARILASNLDIRGGTYAGIFMPFDYLVFFADAGNGDQFGFPVALGSVETDNDVFAWDHEDDSRRWVAPNLGKYLEGWATGKIVL